MCVGVCVCARDQHMKHYSLHTHAHTHFLPPWGEVAYSLLPDSHCNASLCLPLYPHKHEGQQGLKHPPQEVQWVCKHYHRWWWWWWRCGGWLQGKKDTIDSCYWCVRRTMNAVKSCRGSRRERRWVELDSFKAISYYLKPYFLPSSDISTLIYL